VRSEKPYFEDIPEVKLPAEMRELAAHIVQTKSSHFDPAKFDDRYETALIELLRRKQEGKRIEPIREAPQPSNVVNLMDALRKSVQAEGGSSPARGRTAAGERRRSTTRTRKSSGRARKAG
jgi:DNA end-binding protein Ku